MTRDLIVDTFAGGGGASTGIERALGRSPDIAINHDPVALAMHMANHPESRHISRNIWQVDPFEAVGNRPVGLLWASPDCKHFSKAKGGRPVKRSIRDLAWTVVLWAKRARPRVIILENVEEFRDWGPLIVRPDGKWYPDPERAGQTFDLWVRELRRLGYRVEHRELRACDYGAPTIRKRLFLIARRDGRPIVWPKPTHENPRAQVASAASGSARKKPWRTAAEIIDWSLPCPSIFMTREEGRAYTAATGIRVVRPLAEATMARIARGVKRYVIDAAEPFIVGLAHGDSGGRREYDIDEPLTTVQPGGNNQALVTPFVTKFRANSDGHRADEPLATVTANSFDKRPGGVAPLGVVTPYLVSRYGERSGQAPRCQPVDAPLTTIVPTGNGASVVAAFLAQHNTDMVGHDARAPLSTIVQKGCTQGVVAAHMLNMKGGERRDAPATAPLHTLTGEGNHAALVASFLMKYYGEGGQWQGTGEPLHTITVKDRLSLVTVEIAGEPYVIVDIGMRMLTPRERFLAQGFPPETIIDRGVTDGGETTAITATDQGRLCGNSVCPPLAEALVAANCADMAANTGEEAEVA